MKLYRHVFFDLDRTLWDMDSNSKEALFEIFTALKVENLGVINFESFFENYKHINDKLWEKYRKGQILKEDLRFVRFEATLELFDIKNKELAIKMGDAYVEISPLKTRLLPNAMEVLEYLRPNYKLHIITNGFEEVQHLKMKSSGLHDYFSEIITSERANCKKPDPRIFTYAMQAAGANRKDSIMIGDSLELDVLGAKNVGIAQVYFNPEKAKHKHEITHDIVDLKQLKEIL